MIKRSLTISTNATKSGIQPVQSRRSNSTSIQKHHNKSLSVAQSTGSLSNINLSHSTLPSTISEQSDNPTNGNALSSTLVTEWIKALDTFDKGNLQYALEAFNDIEPKNSKINYNIASIYATLGEYDNAVSYFKLAIENDNYMAISYFQIGVCRFLSGLYKKAASSFNTALKLLRGNSVVNYQQLGLEYKLYSCEIMYNRALSYIYSGQMTVGIYDLGFAVKEKRYIAEHGILDEALRHFSKSDDFVKSNNVDIRNMLKLPENFDTKAQRFSILGPPRAEYYNSEKQNDCSSPLSSKSSSEPVPEPSLKEKIDLPSKKMVYSLFSVPQGALFRLTETKVQSILNDKYIGAVIMGMPYPQPPVLQPHFSEKSALRSKGSQSKFETTTEPLQSTTHSHNNSTDSNQQSCNEIVKKHTSKSSSGSSLTMPLKQPKKMPSLPRLPTTTSAKDISSGHNSNQSSMSSNHQTDVESFQKYPYPTAQQIKTPGLKEFDSYFNSIADSQLSASQNHQQQQSSHKYVASFEQNFQFNQQHYNQHNQKLQTTPPLHIKTPPSLNDTACFLNKHNASLPSPPIEDSGHHVNPAIKVKIRFAMETRVTIVRPGISYFEFKKRVRQKLNTSASNSSKNGTNNSYHNELSDDCDDEDSNHHASDGSIPDRLFLRIKDEDGDLVLLGDQEDLDVALGEAILNSQVKNDDKTKNSTVKLTVYCEVMASTQNQGGVQFL